MVFCSTANEKTQQNNDPFSLKAVSVCGQGLQIARAVEFAADLFFFFLTGVHSTVTGLLNLSNYIFFFFFFGENFQDAAFARPSC